MKSTLSIARLVPGSLCLLLTVGTVTQGCSAQQPETVAADAGSGATTATGGRSGTGGAAAVSSGGAGSDTGVIPGTGGAVGSGGAVGTGGVDAGSAPVDARATTDTGVSSGGATAAGGGSATGGAGGASSNGIGGDTAVPVGVSTIRSGVMWTDTAGNLVNAHGGGIIQVGDTYYLHGMYITYSASASSDANKTFKSFSMYSSRDLATWKFEKQILPAQSSGELGPNRIGERPHIIKCPSTGEFVLYAHAASLDYQTDKEVVYATSSTVNGLYAYKGALKNSSGQKIEHSDMSAYVDSENVPYVLTEGGHVFKLSADCHSWLSDSYYSAMGGMESPTVFKSGSTYYWLMSEKTGWRANDNTYATAPAMTGPWTKQGYFAPTGEKTWLSQSTWVLPVTGSKGTVNIFIGDRWDGTESTDHPGRNNTLATLVVQPLVLEGGKISLPTYHATWKLDLAAGTWAP